MLVAEDLALDADRGRPVNRSEAVLPTCLAGALVAELALDGAVRLAGRRLVPVGVAPAGLLGDAHRALASPKGRRAADQLRRLDRQVGGAWSRVVDGLVAQRVVGRDPRGPLQVTAHPVLRRDLRDEVVARLRTAAAGTGPLQPRTAVLLSLTGPARLLEVVADRPHDAAKRRIAEATEVTPVADVVRTVLAGAAAAVATGAAVAATVAATGG